MSVSTDESDLGRIFLIEKFFASEAFLFTGTEWVKFSHLAFSPCTCVGYFAYISRLENTRCMILIFLFRRPHNDMSLHSICISSRKKVSISNFPDQIFQINIQILSSLPFQFFFLSEVSLIVFFRFFHVRSTEVSSQLIIDFLNFFSDLWRGYWGIQILRSWDLANLLIQVDPHVLGLLLHARIPMVFDAIVSPSFENLGDFSPLVSEHLVLEIKNPFLFGRPRFFLNLGI